MTEYTRTSVRFQEHELKIPDCLDKLKNTLNERLLAVKTALDHPAIDIVELDFSESQEPVSREAMDKIVLDECGVASSIRLYVEPSVREVYLDSLRNYYAQRFLIHE
jgi:hypothetical protein